MGRNLCGFRRKIGRPETVMDGAVQRRVGEKGHGQRDHAWYSVWVIRQHSAYSHFLLTHNDEEVHHVILHHVPPGPEVRDG